MLICVVSLRKAVRSHLFLRAGLVFLFSAIPVLGRAQGQGEERAKERTAGGENESVVVHFLAVPSDADEVDSDATCAFTERSRVSLPKGGLLVGGHVNCGAVAVRSVLLRSSQTDGGGEAVRAPAGESGRMPGAKRAASSRGRDAVVFYEVAPTRLRATIDHLVRSEGRQIFAVRASAVESAGREDVLLSRNGGATWGVRGEIPKGPSATHALLVGFAARAGGGVVAATRHEPEGRGAVVVCHVSRDGARWDFFDVLPYEPPSERAAGVPVACPGLAKEPVPSDVVSGVVLPEGFPAKKAWRRAKK